MHCLCKPKPDGTRPGNSGGLDYLPAVPGDPPTSVAQNYHYTPIHKTPTYAPGPPFNVMAPAMPYPGPFFGHGGGPGVQGEGRSAVSFSHAGPAAMTMVPGIFNPQNMQGPSGANSFASNSTPGFTPMNARDMVPGSSSSRATSGSSSYSRGVPIIPETNDPGHFINTGNTQYTSYYTDPHHQQGSQYYGP